MKTRRLLPVLIAGILCVAVRGETSPPPTDLASLLDRTNRDVTTYLDEFSNVTCTERVQQLKLSPKGHIDYHEDHVFEYFVILQGANDDLMLNESRVAKDAPAKNARNTPLLITNGFSMLFLVFHPYYRNSFRFQREEDGIRNGRSYIRVSFSHVHGSRTPVALAVRGREYPLDMTGEAWIERDTGMISRIDAALAGDMHDVGLRSLRAEIDFAPAHLPGLEIPYQFPSDATIEVETLRQHWKNVHQFTNYRRFTVSTQQAVSDVKDKQ